MKKEEWKNINGFIPYEISSHGRIRRNYRNFSGTFNKILIPKIHKDGYERIKLIKSSHNYFNASIHRLVAQAFIPNLENRSQINHKDGNKVNNFVDNLEWYAGGSKIRKGRSKSKVVQCEYTGKPIKVFKTLKEASDETGVRSNYIGKVCNKKCDSAGGFYWKYIE